MIEGAFSQLLDYEERAKQAVLHASSKDQNSDDLSYILFSVNDIIFAIEISEVSDVVQLLKYTEFPSTEEWVIGFSNIKGVPMTMVDFGLLLDKKSSVDGKSQALVLQNEYWLSALVVNYVVGIRHVDEKNHVLLSKDDDKLLNCTHKLMVAGLESEVIYVLNLESVLQSRLNET